MDDAIEAPSYFRYWGKAKKDPDGQGADYHLLAYHSLDVASVGWLLLDPEKRLCQSLADQLKVQADWLQKWFVFCLMLHDLGKFFRAFQNLAPNLSDKLVASAPQCTYKKHHDTLGFLLWHKTLSKKLNDIIPAEHSRAISKWMEIVCGHHGQPPEKSGLRDIRPCLLGEDEVAAEQFVRAVAGHWLPELAPLANIDKPSFAQVSWRLAGLAVLSDWLGSDKTVFKYFDQEMELMHYWDTCALKNAKQVLDSSKVGQCTATPFHSITQQFDFIQNPTPLQYFAQAVSMADQQHLFLLEDVTGAGKTEAAMVLVHRLMADGKASGVYVALPTMAVRRRNLLAKELLDLRDTLVHQLVM